MILDRERLLPHLLALAFVGAVVAQEQDSRPSFPPNSWQQIKPTKKERKRLRHTLVAQLTPIKLFKLQFVRPDGWPETVVTGPDGVVLVRGGTEKFTLANRKVGDRYTIFLSQPDKKRYLEFQRDFVRYPLKTIPSSGWRAHKNARLQLKRSKQFTPKTMFQAFDQPHRLIFEPTKSRQTVVYVLAKLSAGGKDEVASQSLTGELPFWLHAKRGETFRVYALSPHDGTYRVTETMRIQKDYPLGR